MSDEQRGMGPYETTTRRDGCHFAHYGVSLHSSTWSTSRSSFLVVNKMASRRSDLANTGRPLALNEGDANLKQTLEIFDLAPIGHEQDHMVIGFDNRIVMSNDDLVATYNGDDCRSFR